MLSHYAIWYGLHTLDVHYNYALYLFSDRAKLSPSLIKTLVSGGGKGSSSEKNQGVELAVLGEKPAEPGADEPKLPSRDSPLRWAGLVVFAAVSIPLLLTIIILIGIPQ